MAIRNMDSGRKVKEAILKKIPNAKVDMMELDVSSQESVRSFAAEYISSGLPLNILILNAGIAGFPYPLSKDNIESLFATNHLGHFLLSNLLLETMKSTAHKSQKEGRVVFVSSELHKMSYKGGILFDKLNDEKSYSAFSAYGQSKLANILNANELARRLKAGTNLLNNESVSDIDRLRLVMLYALRYEKESPVQLMQLFNKLASQSPKYKPGLVQFLLKQAGVDKRTGDLYGNRDFLNIARNMARGLKGVENVYTQHQPLLFQTMESITKGRLRDVDYPFVGNHFQQARPQEVVIFIVGGSTYEESRSVALQNATNSGIRFILGGSALLNSKGFLKDLEEARKIARSGAGVI